MSDHKWRHVSGWGLARAVSSHQCRVLNDGAAAECFREIQINILVHIINAPQLRLRAWSVY